MLSNQRITAIKEIVAPKTLLAAYPPSDADTEFILASRNTVEQILTGKDSRLMVIVGPCSIHDVDAAIEYAQFFQSERSKVPNLFLVMRVYFEKPRSRLGWKGLIYDPDLDESFQINKGLDIARKLLLTLTQMRIPIGCEFLDTLTPQYLSDLVSWGAIGARTSESQIHRQLASGLSMPIGFKNLTSGDYHKAMDGILSAAYPHHFLGTDDEGKVSHVQTAGNPFGHVILRGGDVPNYDETTLTAVAATLKKEKISTGIIVDCSHGNSQKEYIRQILVAIHMLRLRVRDQDQIPVCGIMLESNLQKGKQPLQPNLKKGVSITDACIDIQMTRQLLHILDAPSMVAGKSLAEVRRVIQECDACIHKGDIEKFPAPILPSKYLLEEDKEIVELCFRDADAANAANTMMMVALRLGLSEGIAERKLQESPFAYLRRQNDFLPLVTRRDVESDILRRFPHPVFLKIMELSKRIQVRCLERLTQDIRLGYLFGPGTFSHEVVQQFRGSHHPYPSFDAMRTALHTNKIDYMIVPTYNSIIGQIYSVSDMELLGTLEHPIELSLYSNMMISTVDAEILYVEPHILKECASYIQKTIRATPVLTKSSVEGCILCIQDIPKGIHSLTISSTNNRSNFLTTVATDLVPHNITTFSLVHLADNELPESMELLCRM
jgi:3-deoxy-7-phosphoheptulonate synthase